MTPVVYIIISVLAIFSACLITKAVTKHRIINKIDFMSDALGSGETSFRYSSDTRINRRLNNSLNRLRSIYENEKNEISERERYFALMLDHVQSGVLVIDGESIRYVNKVALGLLGMSTLSSLRQVENLSHSLADVFRYAGSGDMHASCPSERGELQFSVSACEAYLHGEPVRIVTFNDITNEMENNETESWTRLIRVLTHEIMNTVTPIASLSTSLSSELDQYSSEDIRSALGTIASSSEGLISFVQSYRSLTHISAPAMKAFYFSEIVQDAITIARTNWPETEVSYKESENDIILYADPGQIAQVINNLVKNAVQAGASKVWIHTSIDKRDRVVIDVANNGEPISRSSQEQLFVPFFTTKGSSGTGVGLSLARQMVRLNNGHISLGSSEPGRTVFTLVF